jgi:hypothetical protein
MEQKRSYGERPDLAAPLPEEVQQKLEEGKTKRTMVLLGAEAPPSGRTMPYAKTYVRTQFDNEDNLTNCVKLLRWSNERLKLLPELLNMWCWYRTYRDGMAVFFSTWWWNQRFFEEQKQAFLERLHKSYLEMFGATETNVTVEHEVVGVDPQFHYWQQYQGPHSDG